MSNSINKEKLRRPLGTNTGLCDYCRSATGYFCDGCFDPRLCNECEALPGQSLCTTCSSSPDCHERARYVRFLDFLYMEFPAVVTTTKLDESYFPIRPPARPYPVRMILHKDYPDGTRVGPASKRHNVALIQALKNHAPMFVIYSIIETSVIGNDVAKARWLAYRNQYPLQRP